MGKVFAGRGNIDLQTHDLLNADFSGLPELQKIRTDDLQKRLDGVSARVHEVLKEKEHVVSNERVLQDFDRSALAVMALGWLAQEGHTSREIYNNQIRPSGERPSEKEMSLIGEDLGEGFFTEWTIVDPKKAEQRIQAIGKAFGYGMERRSQTYGREPDGEDHVIGEKAGEVLRQIAKTAPKTYFSDLIEDVYGDGRFGNPSEKERIFTVAAALGYLAAVEDVMLVDDFKKRTLFLSLREGRGDVPPETEFLKTHAEEMVKAIPENGGADIGSLMKRDEGRLENAVLLGLIIRRNQVRLETKDGITRVYRA